MHSCQAEEAEQEKESSKDNNQIAQDSFAIANVNDSDEHFLESNGGNGASDGSYTDQQQEEQSSEETVEKRNWTCHM